MSDSPFFSQRLIACAPDGQFASFSLRKRVSLSQDGLRLGSVLIDPAYIEELVSYGQVLKVRYVTSAGSRAEECFAYPTFLARTGVAALSAAVQSATTAWQGRTGSAVTAQSARSPEITLAIPAIGQKASDGRRRVALATSKVAFPPICPVCCRSASHVSARTVSAGSSERGMWLVPVCDSHQVVDSIRVEKWRANGTDVAFSFSDPDYAQAFARANQFSNEDQRGGRLGSRTFDDGRQFVMYKYVVSALYVSAMLNSRVIAIPRGASRVVPGLRYSALTALIGWWAIPGIVFTIRALVHNFKGGVDVTSLAWMALEGQPVTAYGVS